MRYTDLRGEGVVEEIIVRIKGEEFSQLVVTLHYGSRDEKAEDVDSLLELAPRDGLEPPT